MTRSTQKVSVHVTSYRESHRSMHVPPFQCTTPQKSIVSLHETAVDLQYCLFTQAPLPVAQISIARG
jgi:hypothetical protein